MAEWRDVTEGERELWLYHIINFSGVCFVSNTSHRTRGGIYRNLYSLPVSIELVAYLHAFPRLSR